MMFCEEPFQLPCPVSEETRFTADELQELWSLIQSGDPVSPNSGSEGSSRAVYTDGERRLRRMISNRESARRSRWRKKRHLEDLKDQVNRLASENQELKNQLGSALHLCDVAWKHNEMLRSEYVALNSKLSDLYTILFPMQSQ